MFDGRLCSTRDYKIVIHVVIVDGVVDVGVVMICTTTTAVPINVVAVVVVVVVIGCVVGDCDDVSVWRSCGAL